MSSPLELNPGKRPRGRVGKPQVVSITSILVALNVAVFIADFVLLKLGYFALVPVGQGVVAPTPILHAWGSFTLYNFVLRLQIYRLLTFQFLHANITHLLLNMIGLYIFGPLIEAYLGRWRYLRFYLLCGVGGALLYTLLSLSQLLGGSPLTPLVGASAGIFGILIAAAVIAPDEVVLIYGIVPIRLRNLAWVLLGIAAFTVVFYGHSAQNNAGGQAAHLGGAMVGWLLTPKTREDNR